MKVHGMSNFRPKRVIEIQLMFKSLFGYFLNRSPETVHKRSDTVGEITIRRQKPLVLRIMVEQGRIMILFLSELTPRCEQIFPHRCCFQPVRRIRQQCPIGFRLSAPPSPPRGKPDRLSGSASAWECGGGGL